MRALVLAIVLAASPAAAEVLTNTEVIALDDASASVTKEQLIAAVPSVRKCLKKSATLEVDLVLASGKVKKATVSGSGDRKIDACARRIISKTRIDTKSAVTAKLQIVGSDKMKEVMDAVARGRVGEMTMIGGLKGTPGPSKPVTDAGHTADEISNVIKKNAGAFQLCYRKAMVKQPELSGKFVYTIIIEPDGSVSLARPIAPTSSSRLLDTCISASFRKLKFAAKGKATVNYPLVFSRG